MHKLIEQRREAILALAEKHGVTNVRVFGSMARGTANESSDVDLLVRPLPGTSLLDLGGLVMDAQELLDLTPLQKALDRLLFVIERTTRKKPDDMMIASYCMDHALQLLHSDRDVDPIAQHLSLQS